VVAVGGGLVACMLVRVEALGAALAGEGSRLFVKVLRVWPFLYQ
jgi:hypothetical protein